MAWDTRGNRAYYYTAERVNGRVVKSCFGDGPGANTIAWLTRHDWEGRKFRQDCDQADRETDAALLAPHDAAPRTDER